MTKRTTSILKNTGSTLILPRKSFQESGYSKPDNRRDYGEERLIALGLLGEFVLVAVYTLREQKIRLISTRRANAEERGIYYEYVERGTIKYPWSDERF